MERSAHTPGPWRAGVKRYGTHDAGTPYISHGDTSSVMCFLNLSGAYGGNAGIERAKADANLAAAAPDLLAAAKLALELIDAMMPGVRYIALQNYALLNEAPLALKAAIAKAGDKP